MLPRHDDFGLARRLFEATSIAAAASLLLLQWVRLIVVPDTVHLWTLAVVPLGMTAADFASGLVHWTADTWGSETMPILGRRILHPFRVHHVNPDDFLRRSFLDTNGDVAMIVAPILAGMFWISLDDSVGQRTAAFMLGFCTVGLLTNQVHQWAHMPSPPRIVQLLQDCRIILSSRLHERHHRAPYATDYCIATGWCNAALNATGFFRRLERTVSWATGLEPREDDGSFQEDVESAFEASSYGPSGH